MKVTKQANLTERLETVYQEAKRLVDEVRSIGDKQSEAKPTTTKGRKKKP